MLNFGHDANRTPNPFDANTTQGNQNTCAVRSQELILRDYGIQIPQAELRDYAQEQGWYDDGTPFEDIGKLLNTCGVDTHVSYDNNVYDLINELQQGHRVIVAVDANELWAEPGSLKWHFYQMFQDPNHALIVAGVKVDIEDPSKSTVILTDPGRGDAYIEYSMDHFAKSWQDANCYMCATNEPAPYQYNEETQMMELSNFATDYTIAEFPFHNEFSSIYDLAELNTEDYHPFYFDGHLYHISENLSHEDFLSMWEDSDLDGMNDSFGVDDMDDSWCQFGTCDECSGSVAAADGMLGEYIDPIQEPLELDLGSHADMDLGYGE